MDPLYKGLLWFIPSLVLLLLISFKLFDEDNKISLGSLKETLWEVRGSLFILFLVAAFLQLENRIHDIYEPGFRVTWWFYQVEGTTHIVWLQENLYNYFLVHALSLFYVLGLTFFVMLIPLFFIIRGEKDIFNQFCEALAVNYMFILPGYFFLHVVVTSFYAPEVQPFMYSNPQYFALIQLTNRQTNCFPSGHISIPLTMTLIAMYKAKLKRLGVFGFIFTIITGFAIIYLGVHWIIDIPAGVAVALFAYWSTSNGKMEPLFKRVIEPFERITQSIRDKRI
ncbi:MAG: phosphatase PAP2 family protein [Thermoplasmatota archaeon]